MSLAADMIRLNQADYTAWQLRWLCVEALNSDLREEYKLTEAIMLVSRSEVQHYDDLSLSDHQYLPVSNQFVE